LYNRSNASDSENGHSQKGRPDGHQLSCKLEIHPVSGAGSHLALDTTIRLDHRVEYDRFSLHVRVDRDDTAFLIFYCLGFNEHSI
jgi:hypothetical protein